MKKFFLITVFLCISPFCISALIIIPDTEMDTITGKSGFFVNNTENKKILNTIKEGNSLNINNISNIAAEVSQGLLHMNQNQIDKVTWQGVITVTLETPMIVELNFDGISWGDTDGINGAGAGYLVIN